MDQEKLMRQVKPGALHVIVARRADGPVGFLYSRDPLQWLAIIGSHVQLEEVEVRPSKAAVRVTEHLRSRFLISHVPSDALPWYLVDYAQAIAALDEMDLETGLPVDGLALGHGVYVMPQRLRGKVFGFTRGGDVVVRLDGSSNTANIIVAPRENLKPIVRVQAAA